MGEKSVYASGENIMVSVNFPESSNGNRSAAGAGTPSPKKASKPESTKKPSVIIDILDDEVPYRVIEPAKPVVDLASDPEEENEVTAVEVAICEREPTVLSTPSKGPMTPPEPIDRYDPFDPTVSPDNEPESLPACHTPPLQPSTPPPGPQTPPPSTSPHDHVSLSPGGVNLQEVQLTPPLKNSSKRAPLYSSLPPNVSAALPAKPKPNTVLDVSANGSSPMDMDLDCDSPFSPGSASGLSDLFEPPNSSPPPSSLPRIGLPGSRSKKKGRASDSSAWQSIIGGQSGVGELKNKRKSSRITQAQNGASSKQVQTKVIDNKLKIIDDVPSSAVEMAVKEKFLKKVQRQERIVEEVKLVLKPAYNARKINKEAYKEILRKTVPKVCHSRYGEINPSKIEKLVQGYIKKHQHLSKKKLKPRKSF